MFTTDTAENNNLTVMPVICVGLGGTGRDVLVRIRQNIIEEFGSLADLPIVSFVQIDTDRGGPIPSYRGQSIEFTPAEEVHIRVSLNEVNEFKQNYERRKKNTYVQNSDDHILEWFPDQLIRNLSAIEQGAGAVRAVGRFALFKNYDRVVRTLNLAHGRVVGADAGALIARGIEVRPGLRVFVAGSLCGGTGSGLFLDIGYILRRLFAESVPNFETYGYFVVSPDLYGGNDVVKANCYAALKELDYYTRKGTIFNAQYPGERRLGESRPPYDYIYLMSNATPGGTFIIPPTDPNAKGKIANTIAQKICLFLSSSATAAAAISARDNLRSIDATEEYDKHPRPNRQRYMATGLASIYFPQDKINLLAANQIKIQVLEFWKNGLGQAPTNSQMQQFYTSQFDWGTDDLGQLLKQRLEKVPVQGGTLSANLERWRNDQYSQISAAQSRGQQDLLKTQFPQNAMALLNYVRPAENSKERGVWLTPIVEHTSDVTNDIKASIEKFLEQILQPDHQFFGLDNAINWLQGLKTNFERVRAQYEANRPQNADAELRNITTQLQNEVQAIQGQLLPFGKTAKIQTAFRVAVDQVLTLARQNYQSQVSRQARVATEDLIVFTNQKIAQLVQLRNFIQENILVLQRRGEKLSEVNVQERIGLPIVNPQDTENAINAVLPPKEGERRLALEQLSTEVIQKAVVVSTEAPPSLERFLKPQFTAEVPIALDQVVDRRISTLMLALRGSAIQRFMEMGSREQLIAYLTSLKNQSDILLPLNLNDGYFNNAPHKRTVFIAYHQPPTEDAYVQAFTQLLTETGILGNAQRVQLPASEQHQVIFMTEYAGFPLRLINDLTAKNFQYAYENRGDAGNFDALHTNKTITLTDILPPPPEVVREVQELFFKCLGLRMFALEGDNLVFDPKNKGRKITFGNDWSVVIDQLTWVQIRNQDQRTMTLTDVLHQQLNGVIELLVSNPPQWQKDYRPHVMTLIEEIRAYPPDHINFAMVPIVAGTEIQGLTEIAQKGILEELIEELDKRIEDRWSRTLTSGTTRSDRLLNQSPPPEQQDVDAADEDDQDKLEQ
ncbi:tubulin-like doman-containing protein [Thermosynechococcus sp. JY1334]|uniref:tubulin-like doman-containing protein n=1 Tax=unclassified Thermosynechococcus TaxID=2622553 RepID=UPI00267128C2|nr:MULTISPECIES: tubulin-like doman-containing protein [unclassified Thermosynechococcus]MDR7897166.1 tubulin-like doman-containing protein [Thermosynechococcus sp. JY1332]MDR7904564.1 tubulin-like doman-containing protein [Thermosynechococcus sp. JY1334]WKT86804.1 tubulin-like doman-containing protein [Thermosynechococcus sp. JY1339]WNC55745.1 tubulin-like doman-containing protein [Thermosynechococcus sp. JY1331]